VSREQIVGDPTGREHLTPLKIKSVSATERASFRRCRRQWFLTQPHRLTSATGNVNFWFGDLWHGALETYYETLKEYQDRGHSADVAWAEELAANRYQDLYDETTEQLKQDLGGAWSIVEQAYREMGELGMEMLNNYLDRERRYPLLDEIIRVEFRVNVAIRTEGGRKIGTLSVKADCVGRKDGELVVVDHKTAGREHSSAQLDLDDQLTAEAYSWFLHSGEMPSGAIYNVALKKAPKPPKLIKKGKALSQNKTQITTYDLYVQAIRDNGFDLNDYGDMLNVLLELKNSGEDLPFRREYTPRSESQLAAFERDLREEFRDMKAVAAHPERAYPNPSPFNCPSCPVRVACLTIQDGGDVEAVIKAEYKVAAPRY
jgi:hypothetical protein